MIATLATEAEREGFDVLICTGRPRRVPAGQRQVTVLYPRKGVSDLARMTPTAVEETLLRHPGPLSRPGGAGGGDQRQPARRPRSRARRPRPSGSTTYDGLDNLVAHAGELKGKAAEAFKERIEDVLRNRQINALVRDLELPVSIDDLERRPWDREATHQLFDGLEFRVLRDRLLEALPNEEIEPEGGFELSGAILRPGRCRRLAGTSTAAGRSATGRGRDRALGLGHRRHRAVALAAADGAAAYVDVTELSPPTTNGARRPGWPTRTSARPCTTPRVRCWPSGPAAGISPG